MTEIHWARIIFIALFVLIAVAVFLLPQEYVFRGAPNRAPWRDLRYWALLNVVIHTVVYLWF